MKTTINVAPQNQWLDNSCVTSHLMGDLIFKLGIIKFKSSYRL